MPLRGLATSQDQLDPSVAASRTNNRVDLILRRDKGNEISRAWACERRYWRILSRLCVHSFQALQFKWQHRSS